MDDPLATAGLAKPRLLGAVTASERAADTSARRRSVTQALRRTVGVRFAGVYFSLAGSRDPRRKSCTMPVVRRSNFAQ